MTRENLVVLQYSPNPCYVQVVRPEKVADPHFELDPRRGVWHHANGEYPIGSSRPVPNSFGQGVIGVYNPRKLRDLEAMVHTVSEIQSRQGQITSNVD